MLLLSNYEHHEKMTEATAAKSAQIQVEAAIAEATTTTGLESVFCLFFFFALVGVVFANSSYKDN